MLLALDLEKTPRLVVSSRISFPIAPVILRISSRPHAPASALCPSTQFRKGRGPGHNRRKHYAIFKELPPFRAWVLGGDGSAGVWEAHQTEALCARVGYFNNFDGVYMRTVSAPFIANLWNGNNQSWSTVEQPQYPSPVSSKVDPLGSGITVPPNIWQPIILYLGRPR